MSVQNVAIDCHPRCRWACSRAARSPSWTMNPNDVGVAVRRRLRAECRSWLGPSAGQEVAELGQADVDRPLGRTGDCCESVALSTWVFSWER